MAEPFLRGHRVDGDAEYDGYWTTGTEAPTSGAWKRGNICWNEQPSDTTALGWICVESGSPGTWSALIANEYRLPTVPTEVAEGRELTVPEGTQLAVFGTFTVDGTLTVDGELRVSA